MGRMSDVAIEQHNVLESYWNGVCAQCGSPLTDDDGRNFYCPQCRSTYCPRCKRTDTDARAVYYPISDEYIQLCTNCEPDDVAVSTFEMTFASVEHLQRFQEEHTK